jgi:hypothetical protein
LSAILARSGPVEGVVIVGSSSSCEDSRICCLRQADNGERRRRLALGRFVLAERAGVSARAKGEPRSGAVLGRRLRGSLHEPHRLQP